MIVKTLEFRKKLKELLESSWSEELILDYYGDLFKITPVKRNSVKMTQSQKVIAKYSKLKRQTIKDPIFNEQDPAMEKENFRNYRYNKND